MRFLSVLSTLVSILSLLAIPIVLVLILVVGIIPLLAFLPALLLLCLWRVKRPSPNYLRALRLLVRHLTGRQRATYLLLGYFSVQGSDGHRYVIRDHLYGNILGDGDVYCAYPLGVPYHDKLLAQKLMLETNAPLVRRYSVYYMLW